MNRTINVTLNRAGINTDQFLSLQIDKGDLPEGASIIVQIKDARTGEVYPVDLGNMDERRAFARNSRFHGQTMRDGHIFNPYIHRRHIAAQFMRLVKRYGTAGLKGGISREFNWQYAIDVLRKEVHALANLQKHDARAFQERNRFFTLAYVSLILDEYKSAVVQLLDNYACTARNGQVYVPDYGLVKAGNIRPMKHRFNTLAADARKCGTYKQLDDLLTRFEWLKLPDNCKLPDSFVNPFIEAGAYFTLKHRIMFEGLTLWRMSQTDSFEQLRQHQGKYLDLFGIIT